MGTAEVFIFIGLACLIVGALTVLLSFSLGLLSRGKDEEYRIHARNDLNRVIIMACSDSPRLQHLYDMLNRDGKLLEESIREYRSY